jgi:branched-chain amino acid transport system substrate-binding protein
LKNRRAFIQQSAAAASALAFPIVGGAQPKPVKVGILHPVTGALAYSGQQCREGALMAIEDINKTGIKSLGERRSKHCSAMRKARRRPVRPRSRR